MERVNTRRSLLDETYDGLDCIDLTYYIDIDKSLEDIMTEIQIDFEYDHLTSDAMYIFSKPCFHHDVFRAMDEGEFDKYLRERYADIDDIDLDFENWFEEEGSEPA